MKKIPKKIISLILSVVFMSALFSGCTTANKIGKKAGGEVLTINLGAEPKTIDPALNAAIDGSNVIVNSFEGLMRLDEKDKPIPGIAKSYEVSKDGLTYTFHLRDNALWSDGKPVTAGDFEYAWKRALNPDTASEYAYQLYYLKNGQGYNESKLPANQKTPGIKPSTEKDVGVIAKDDKTLVVTLENPTAYFLTLMAFPTYMPVRKDVVEKDKAWATKPETYICNGAFKMKEWKPKDVLVFVKNNKYWDAGTVKLSQINYKMLDDQNAYLSAFKAGQLDMIDNPPQQETPTLIKDGTAKVYPNLATYYYCPNLSAEANKIDPAAAKALKDKRVRKALSLAINRKDITDNVAKGGQIPATSFVPKGVVDEKGNDFDKKEYYKPEGDVALAKKLLAEAGYPNGKGFPTITLLYNTSQNHQNLAAAVQDMWRKNLGINIELKNEEWKVFQTTRREKQFLLARHGWSADYNDPMTFLDLFVTNGGNNDASYSNPEYDKKIMAAKKELDPAKRMVILHQAEDILMDDMAIIPVYYYTTVVALKSYVKGVVVSPLGQYYLTKAYIEK